MAKFNLGDDAWIYLSNHQGELTKGKVIAELDLPGYGFKNYVIEIDTSVDPLLEIRAPGLGMYDRDIHATD